MIARPDTAPVCGLVRYVGFIRNVMTGRNGLTAERLLQIVQESGGRRPASHRGTGNIAFDALPADLPNVTDGLEAGIAEVIGRHEPIFVRSLDHLRRAAERDPFGVGAPMEGVHERCVSYVQSPLSALGPLPVRSRRGDLVVFDADDLDVYSVTILVDGRATSPGPLLQRASGASATSRNWSTVEYILSKEEPNNAHSEGTPQWT